LHIQVIKTAILCRRPTNQLCHPPFEVVPVQRLGVDQRIHQDEGRLKSHQKSREELLICERRMLRPTMSCIQSSVEEIYQSYRLQSPREVEK